MPLSKKGLKQLATAAELLKVQIDLAREVLTEKQMSHTDQNVIGLAQILATNLLCISTNEIAIRPLKQP